MKKNKPERPALDTASGRKRIVYLPVLALLLTLIVEGFNQGGPGPLVDFIVTHPLYFLYNVLIVLTTLVFSELFKRRKAVLYTTGVIWIALGVGAFMVSRERTQPFTSMDLLMLKDAITLTTVYYTWPQIILMYGSIFAAILLVIWMITKLPRRKRVNYTVSLSVFCGFLTLSVLLCTLGVYFGSFPRYYDNLVDAYDEYGFATVFTFTFGDMGVEKPSDYSDETVTGIVEEIDSAESPEATAAPGPHIFGEADDLARPNILFVQLESFFDVNTIIGAEYESDPTPNFNALSREYPSGELYVPSIGGGTANVEFEVLSGLNLDFFGANEQPYNTVLQEKTCETIAYNLRELDYATTAMHNHTGTFYSRNEVYSRLGFEHFVSVEYMPYVTYTDIGWAEDIVLCDEILKAMNATKQRDFVMAITVESHGKYDENYAYREGDPVVLSLPEQLNAPKFSSYLRLISATDQFIGQLIDALEAYPEPVVCVFYGDHLPGLDLTADLLTTDNLYASRYIIWNNYGAEFDAPDLQAYRLSANLLRQLGVSGGVVTRYHQSSALDGSDEGYLEKLEMLEYDLLYGDLSVYEGVNPYEPVDLTLGSVPIEISSVSNRYGRVLVSGENFTEYSSLLINGEAYPTAFISSSQIVAIVPRSVSVEEIAVAQVTSAGVELSRTEPFVME